MLLLGAPSLGLTYGVTVLAAYLPTVLHELANPLFIGIILSAEGVFGLFLPMLAGRVADRSPRVIDRYKYLVPAAVLMIVALALVGERSMFSSCIRKLAAVCRITQLWLARTVHTAVRSVRAS